MSFNILDHISESDIVSRNSSHLICICPVCHGKKLKISLSDSARGAYKCWTGNCTPESIRKALGVIPEKNAHLSPFKTLKPLSPFDNWTIKTIPLVPLLKPMKLCRINPPPCIAKRGSVSSFTGEYLEETIYPYSDNFRVLRVDIFDSEGNRREKQVFVQKKEQGVWIGGVPETLIPLYTYNLLFDLQDEGNTILFVEGEKVTEFLKREGYAAVTACSSKFNVASLIPAFKILLFKYPFIKNVLIIPDNDEPGKHKAEIVQNACSSVGIGTETIFLETVLQESLPANFDLADTTSEQFRIFETFLQDLENES